MELPILVGITILTIAFCLGALMLLSFILLSAIAVFVSFQITFMKVFAMAIIMLIVAFVFGNSNGK